MAGYENHAGLSITGSKLQLVEVICEEDRYYLNNIDEAYFSESLNFESDKETKIGALMQGAFDELLLRKPLSTTQVSFSLPFDIFYLAQLPYDHTLLHHDLTEEFKWELSVLYPFISSKDLVVRYVEIPENEIVPFNTALIAATNRRYISVLHNFCKRNKLKLKFVDNVHFASERALTASSGSLEGLILNAHLSQGFLSIMYTINSKPVYAKVFRINDASEVPAIIRIETSSSAGREINKANIQSAYLSGEQVNPSLSRTLSEQTGISFNLFNPFQNITPSPGITGNKFLTEKYATFSPAAGIAYRLA